MEEVQYVGEHLFPGQLGHFLVLTSFVFSILSVAAYRKSFLSPTDTSWLKFARFSWGIHSIGILGTIATLFFIMVNQYYEYRYVWDHVSDALPMQYIFVAFWEAQEGSFLLWMFWHVVLGFVLIFTAKKWESGVMTWLAAIQVVLTSMILGIHFGDAFKIGSSPFLLLRDTLEAPIFTNPNYLSMIEGNGLNPLLQNYWMTIHPPTLFLGFASVSIPFCFAMAGIWKKEHLEWMKPVMPWSLFSAGILGVGILMGAAWAYEALTFGGYWAWDPVENMSLVPWIILLAAIHGNFIARHTGQSVKATYIFYFLSFILICYSTFLTRSGILGEESKHAFTEMGLEWQLVGLIFIFLIASAFMLISRWKSIPVVQVEEKINSREFWMFVGSLVLAFSAFLITFTTSIPVWNAILDGAGSLFNTNFEKYHRAMPIDVVSHHNQFQLWVGVLLVFLSTVGLILRFKAMGWEEHKKKFLIHLAISIVLGAASTGLLALWINLPSWQYVVLLFAASFGIISNLDYIIRFSGMRWRSWGPPLAHGGFAIMLVGVMASGLNKRIISENRFAQEGLATNMDLGESILLIKHLPMFMNGYWVTYKSDTLDNLTKKYLIDFVQVNEKGDTIDKFQTTPDVLYNVKLEKVAANNPDTKHYPDRDFFTYIDAIPEELQDIANIRKIDSSLAYQPLQLKVGDSIYKQEFVIRLDSLTLGSNNPNYKQEEEDLTLSANLSARFDPELAAADSTFDRRAPFQDSATYSIFPTLIMRKGFLFAMTDQINPYNLRARLKSEAIEGLMPMDDSIKYETIRFKFNEAKTWNGLTIQLTGIDKEAQHPNYKPQEGDIAIHGVVEVKTANGKMYSGRPLYYIRGGSPYSQKAFIPDLGLHIRLDKIDPESETFDISLGQPNTEILVPLEVAFDAPRNDFIVLKAILFPGINLVWLGCMIMLAGMFVGMFKRLIKPK